MSARSGLKRCRQCGKQLERFDVARGGELVSVKVLCRCPFRPKRRWTAQVDAERRRACICQRCDQPTVGRPKVALYCAEHRREAYGEAQARHRAKVGNKHQRAYYERHKEKVRRKARAAAQRERAERAEYKRAWRKRNRDKVRAQKRRSALRRGGGTPPSVKRWRQAVAAGEHQPQREPRNARGERICLHGCGTVVRGRAKMCAACKDADRRTPLPVRGAA